MSNQLDEMWRSARLSIRKRWHELRGEKYFLRHIDGVCYLLDKDNNVDRRVDAFGMYEPEQMSTLLGLMERLQPQQFLDVGAHWGLYSIQVAMRPALSATQITAFEPDSVNRAQLFGNLFVNRIENVTVLPVGLSDRDGSASFQRKGEHNRGASRIAEGGAGQIEIRRLDALIKAQGQRIAVKIDVEGHELQALAGMRELLDRNECLVQIECYQPDARQLLDMAFGSSYRHVRTIASDWYYSNSAALT